MTAGRRKTAFFDGCLWYESEEEQLRGEYKIPDSPASQIRGGMVGCSINSRLIIPMFSPSFPSIPGNREVTYCISRQSSILSINTAIGVNPTALMPAGTTIVTLTVSSGTSSATDTVNITVQDTVKLNTTAVIAGTTGDNDWFISDPNITLSATDSGSGVKEIHRSLDGGPETVISGASAYINLTGDGIHSVTYYAQDNALNSETPRSAVLKIDKTPPNITATVSPSANAAGWNNANVTVTFNCTDATSGIAGCTPPVTVSAEGQAQTVNGSAKDNAGNTSSASVTLSIDKTPPAITITGITDGATYIRGSAPVAGYTATDTLSGIESESAGLTGGNANSVGTYTYTVNAADKAGNSKTIIANYTVVYTFSGFLEPVSLGMPFKLGSTIPVKFQLMNALGGYVSTANATIMLQMFSGSVPVGEPIDATPAGGSDSGITFRYDATANQYIFNLNTINLSQGTWQIIARLDDGSVKTAFLSLK